MVVHLGMRRPYQDAPSADRRPLALDPRAMYGMLCTVISREWLMVMRREKTTNKEERVSDHCLRVVQILAYTDQTDGWGLFYRQADQPHTAGKAYM